MEQSGAITVLHISNYQLKYIQRLKHKQNQQNIQKDGKIYSHPDSGTVSKPPSKNKIEVEDNK